MTTGPVYDRRRVFWAACLGMLVFGVVLTTLGAILPSLIERFGIDKAEAGSLLLLMSLGVLVGSLVFGPAADRYGYKGLLLLALGVVLVGLEGIAAAPTLPLLRLSVLLVGAAGGVLNGATSALVSDISEGKRGAGLNLLGIFFGLGAVGTPFVLALLLDHFPYRPLVAWTGVVTLPVAAWVAAIRFPVPKAARTAPVAAGAGLVRDPVLLTLGVMLLLQSGMEMTVGGWTATYYQEELGLDGNQALFYLSLYWLGLMLGRLVAGTALRGIAGHRLIAASIGVALIGSALLITSEGLRVAALGSFLLGVGFAAVFPLILSLVGDRYTERSGTAFSFVLVLSLFGPMLMPFLTGVLGEAYGMRASLLVLPASLVTLLLLLRAVTRRLG